MENYNGAFGFNGAGVVGINAAGVVGINAAGVILPAPDPFLPSATFLYNPSRLGFDVHPSLFNPSLLFR